MNTKLIQGSNIVFTNRFKGSQVTFDTVKNSTLVVKNAVKEMNYFHAAGTDTSTIVNNSLVDMLNIYPTIVNTSSNYVYNDADRKVTVNSSGLYFISATCDISANGAGVRQISILVNDTMNKGQKVVYRACPTGMTRMHTFGLKTMNAGDTLKIQVYQNSGSSLTLGNNTTGQTFLLIKLS
jgi:hypothetical protein